MSPGRLRHNTSRRPAWVRPLLLTLSSSVLLVASFPNWNQPWCAWVALVPWLIVLKDLTGRQAFWWSYLVGVVFFLGSIWWVGHVTLVGLVVLCAYLALFFAVFGWWGRVLLRNGSQLWQLILIPSAWVGLEYVRSHLFSGFGWNLLGYTQTPALAAIQIADVTGVWGVSFVIAAFNVAITAVISLANRRKALGVLLIAVGFILAVHTYGTFRLGQPQPMGRLTVAVVQGNIPQEQKWDPAWRSSILERYARFSHQAAAAQPDLIVWPETSVPGVLGQDSYVTQFVRDLGRSVQRPLLVGAAMPRPDRGRVQLANSAALIDSSGAIVTRYDKVHLVPFGEFVPGESMFPWLRMILPPIGNFVPGQDYTVFEPTMTQGRGAGGSVPPFSVLICFEDIFPNLARRFVQDGAQWLMTITNDAWFGKTAAAYQHAQASTFRAVELRRPVVRAANTGWSGCISARGEWLDSVQDASGEELFVEGLVICDIPVPRAAPPHAPRSTQAAAGSPTIEPPPEGAPQHTVYSRWGDWFAGLCLVVLLGWWCWQLVVNQNVTHTSRPRKRRAVR